MGLSRKVIKCTISFNLKPVFTCDLLLWQNIPSDIGPYRGYFERINNNKPLQMEVNQGVWELNTMIVPGTRQPLQFWRDALIPKKPQIMDLVEVPFDFIDLVIAGQTFSEKDRGIIYKPIAQLDWRLWT